MPKLSLGVLDVAYSDAQGGDGTTTTGEVADILEKRYQVMQTFFDLKGGLIADAIGVAMGIQIQNLMRGEKIQANSMHGAEQKIEHLFRSFLDANEMQKLTLALSGAPLSIAAMKGQNQRKLKPSSKRNKARPAFVDSGLYRRSFQAKIRL